MVQVKGTGISISGPRALQRAIGEAHSGEEMGGWEIHSRVTGLVDRVAEDEDECFRIIREFLRLSAPEQPGSCRPSAPSPRGRATGSRKSWICCLRTGAAPTIFTRSSRCLVDHGRILELKPDMGRMVVTCLARIHGETVGFIASNPMVNAGAMDTQGAGQAHEHALPLRRPTTSLSSFSTTPLGIWWAGKRNGTR